MGRRHRSNQGTREECITPESVYARGKSATWLCRAMEAGLVSLDSNFFDCLDWSMRGLKRLLLAVIEAAKSLPKTRAHSAACKAARNMLQIRDHRLGSAFEELITEHPCLTGSIEDAIRRECAAAARLGKTGSPQYRQAVPRLSRVFGISQEAGAVCEFVFFLERFRPVENYFEDHLDIHRYPRQRLFARLLGLTHVQALTCVKELTACGLLNKDGHNDHFRLQDGIAAFWDEASTDPGVLFCRPLKGNALHLQDFSVPKADVEHARALLEKEDKAPVHILLYGPPGTGKTSFAHSLAQACGMKAWSVTSRKNDDDDDRRASLTACLHMAARHKGGAFVLVDEAERLLDTDMYFGRQTKDKAWLNSLLEQPGKRVIWITNNIGHIDQAVRRRFTFSIRFEELGRRERLTIWRQIAARHRVESRLPEDRLQQLINEYPVAPAVIENAVTQAKRLHRKEKSFADAVECALRAYVTLRRDGDKVRAKVQAVDDFSLDGVCLEGSAHALLDQCRRVDSAMREAETLRPGCATMLFYGPPGTGKTALARYIAKELDRECIVKRASDLLSMWVGESEKQVADAFMRAEREGAILVIDEADSFLYSRDMAQRSWESTLVNEFLTCLEECRAFCICTTNRRENLDAAAMRRFSHKVAFGYAKPEQVQALYAGLLHPLCAVPLPPELENELLQMRSLTPGDFHAVRSQYASFFGHEEAPTHQRLIAALKREQRLKVEQGIRHIGFGADA